MSKAAKSNHLAEVKMALARKYDNLARIAKSKPRRRVLLNRAIQYRREAAQ
ncbi:MAG: hypothetical protein GXY83_10785 [Rhodopirellula sp.]|nr:hypothetical protein [Rhodopirellula sp.]